MAPRLKADVLVVSADAFGPRFLPAVRHLLGDTGHARPAEFPADLERAMAHPDTPPVVILVHDPVLSLAHRLADSAAPQAPLQDWMAWAETVLNARRAAPQRVTLVDARLFSTNDPDARMALSERLDRPVPDLLAGADDGAPPPARMLLAAFALLAVTPDAAGLAQDLRGLTLRPDTEPVDAETVRAALAQADAATSEETRLLREGLRLQDQVIDHLATARVRNAQLMARLADHEILLAEVDALSRQLADSEAARKRQTALLGAQVLDDAERLAVSEGKAAELSRVYASRSWRITRPLRGLRRPSKPR